MENKEQIRNIAIAFAEFLTHECFQSGLGYVICPEPNEPLDQNEYEIDELYDYWLENIFL